MSAKQPKDIKVLLVDDEPDFRNLMAFSLKRREYQVLLASNGREAFNLMQSNPVDVVISDIRMPDGDGVELLDRIRANNIETPIILLITGFTELSTEEALNRGAEAVLSKPFDIQTLVEVIERLLTPSNERWARTSVGVTVELNIELQFEDISQAIAGKVMGLGRGGMFVSLNTGQFPNASTDVAFKIVFDGADTALSGNGLVRWVRVKSSESAPAGCGIEFMYLEKAAREKILALLGTTKPKAYIPIK